MNINVLLLHIQKSNLDEAIKSNLVTILDKAINDGDTVARLEERIREAQDKINDPELPSVVKGVFKMIGDTYQEIIHGDKPVDPS